MSSGLTTTTIIVAAFIIIIVAVSLGMLAKAYKTGSNVVPFVMVSFVLMLSAGFALYWFWGRHQEGDAVSMGVMVVAAIATLLSVLFTLTAGFSAMGLADKAQPLGLPEGSIRAMIALVLIIVFILFGIHLFNNSSAETSTYLGERRAPLADSSNVKPPNRLVYYRSSDTTFSVWLFAPVSDEAKRLAQQLITTVGTLVVAVAGFYFGSSATSGALTGAAVPPPSDQSVAGTAALELLKSKEPDEPPLSA
jgi:hypothetical protein